MDVNIAGIPAMDIIGNSQQQINRMEIVENGRRRRFSDEAKRAIFAESYSGTRQVTVTARRHEVTHWQWFRCKS
jgi:transposase